MRRWHSGQARPAGSISHPVSWADTTAAPLSHLEERNQGILIGTLVGLVSLSQAFKGKGLESVQINNPACPASYLQPGEQENAFLLALILLCPQ